MEKVTGGIDAHIDLSHRQSMILGDNELDQVLTEPVWVRQVTVYWS